MPLLLLIPVAVGGWWLVNKQLQETETLAIKGAVIAAVVYIAWANRGKLGKLV